MLVNYLFIFCFRTSESKDVNQISEGNSSNVTEISSETTTTAQTVQMSARDNVSDVVAAVSEPSK